MTFIYKPTPDYDLDKASYRVFFHRLFLHADIEERPDKFRLIENTMRSPVELDTVYDPGNEVFTWATPDENDMTQQGWYVLYYQNKHVIVTVPFLNEKLKEVQVTERYIIGRGVQMLTVFPDKLSSMIGRVEMKERYHWIAQRDNRVAFEQRKLEVLNAALVDFWENYDSKAVRGRYVNLLEKQVPLRFVKKMKAILTYFTLDVRYRSYPFKSTSPRSASPPTGVSWDDVERMMTSISELFEQGERESLVVKMACSKLAGLDEYYDIGGSIISSNGITVQKDLLSAKTYVHLTAPDDTRLNQLILFYCEVTHIIKLNGFGGEQLAEISSFLNEYSQFIRRGKWMHRHRFEPLSDDEIQRQLNEKKLVLAPGNPEDMMREIHSYKQFGLYALMFEDTYRLMLQIVPKIDPEVIVMENIGDEVVINYSKYLLSDAHKWHFLSYNMTLFDPQAYSAGAVPIEEIKYAELSPEFAVRLFHKKDHRIDLVINEEFVVTYILRPSESFSLQPSIEGLLRQFRVKLVNHPTRLSAWAPDKDFTLVPVDVPEDSHRGVVFCQELGGMTRITIAEDPLGVERTAWDTLPLYFYKRMAVEHSWVTIGDVERGDHLNDLYSTWMRGKRQIYHTPLNIRKVEEQDYEQFEVEVYRKVLMKIVPILSPLAISLKNSIMRIVPLAPEKMKYLDVAIMDMMAYPVTHTLLYASKFFKTSRFNDHIIPSMTDVMFNRLSFSYFKRRFGGEDYTDLQRFHELVDEWLFKNTAKYAEIMRWLDALRSVMNRRNRINIGRLYVRLYISKPSNVPKYFRLLMSKYREWTVKSAEGDMHSSMQIQLHTWQRLYKIYPYVSDSEGLMNITQLYDADVVTRENARLKLSMELAQKTVVESFREEVKRTNVGLSDDYDLDYLVTGEYKFLSEIRDISIYQRLIRGIVNGKITEAVVVDKLVFLNSIYTLYYYSDWMKYLSVNIKLRDLVFIKNFHEDYKILLRPEHVHPSRVIFLLSLWPANRPFRISDFDSQLINFRPLCENIRVTPMTPVVKRVNAIEAYDMWLVSRVKLAVHHVNKHYRNVNMAIVTFASYVSNFMALREIHMFPLLGEEEPELAEEGNRVVITSEAAIDHVYEDDYRYRVAFRGREIEVVHDYFEDSHEKVVEAIEKYIENGYSRELIDRYVRRINETLVYFDAIDYFEMHEAVRETYGEDSSTFIFIDQRLPLDVPPAGVVLSDNIIFEYIKDHNYILGAGNVERDIQQSPGLMEALRIGFSAADYKAFKDILMHSSMSRYVIGVVVAYILSIQRPEPSRTVPNTESEVEIVRAERRRGPANISFIPDDPESWIYETDTEGFGRFFGIEWSDFIKVFEFHDQYDFTDDVVTQLINIYLKRVRNNPACDYILTETEHGFAETLTSFAHSVYPDLMRFRIAKVVLVFVSKAVSYEYEYPSSRRIHPDAIEFVMENLGVVSVRSTEDLMRYIKRSQFNNFFSNPNIDMTDPSVVYKQMYDIRDERLHYSRYGDSGYLSPWSFNAFISELSKPFNALIDEIAYDDINPQTSWFNDEVSISLMTERAALYTKLINYIVENHSRYMTNAEGIVRILRRWFAFSPAGYVHGTWMHHVVMERLFVNYFLTGRSPGSLSLLQSTLFLFVEPTYGWYLSAGEGLDNRDAVRNVVMNSIGVRLFSRESDFDAANRLRSFSALNEDIHHMMSNDAFLMLDQPIARPNFWEARSFRFIDGKIVPYTLDIVWLRDRVVRENNHVSPLATWFK
jgi:hypothetical protein